MSDPTREVLVERGGHVLLVTLNRPEARNAVNAKAHVALGEALEEAEADPEIRCVIVTGAGDKAFCAGADLVALSRGESLRPEDPAQAAWGFAGFVAHPISKPVIAAVNGTAAGVGAHLALCCDLVIMADHAKFIEVFARRGLVPDGLGAWILPRLVGLQKARELMFFAEDIPADEALRIGLCNKVVPGDDLEDATTEWAERLASGPTRSLMLTKWLVNRSLDVDRRTLEDNEAWAVELNSRTLDSQEGIASFRERRDPVWRGY